MCVFENALANARDPNIEKQSHLLFLEQEVYHWVDGAPTTTTDDIRATLRAAKSIAHFIGVMTMLPSGAPVDDRRELALDHLRDLAAAACVVIAGAYDGESYVVGELA